VLAGRGLSGSVPAGGRRKVQITLVSTKDPLGEAFGAKVSPWTETRQGRAIRFGQSGLKCSFKLSGRGASAIALTSDPRFADTAHLRVRLLASAVSTKNSVWGTAASILPTSVMDFASTEVDEATAQLEAEVKVPLTNILSGRFGHAADRALGGWVPLRSCLEEDDGPLNSKDEIPPALWMQMYVLPDHDALVPKLLAQLDTQIQLIPAAVQAPSRDPPGKSSLLLHAALGSAGGAAPSSAPARWGGAGQKSAPAANTQVVDNLIDITLDDSRAQPKQQNLLDDYLGSLLDSNDSGLQPAMMQSIDFGEPSPQSLPVASGFGFVQGTGHGYAAAQPSMLPTASAATGSSAFGFIAGSSQGAQLDLASLYASSEPPKATPVSSADNYSALYAFTDLKPEPAPKKAAAGGSLESLEASILADLKF